MTKLQVLGKTENKKYVILVFRCLEPEFKTFLKSFLTCPKYTLMFYGHSCENNHSKVKSFTDLYLFYYAFQGILEIA